MSHLLRESPETSAHYRQAAETHIVFDHVVQHDTLLKTEEVDAVANKTKMGDKPGGVYQLSTKGCSHMGATLALLMDSPLLHHVSPQQLLHLVPVKG